MFGALTVSAYLYTSSAAFLYCNLDHIVIALMTSVHLNRFFSFSLLAYVLGGSGVALGETPQCPFLLAFSLLGLYFGLIVLYRIVLYCQRIIEQV
jgi:hypothetical protein